MPIPLPTISDVFRCALEWTHGPTSQTAVNVIHIRSNTTGATATDAFNALDASVDSSQFDALSGFAAVLTVAITPLDGTSATSSFSTGSPAKWSGVATGDFVPQSPVIVKLQTGVRGRDNRGRIFLPFVTEGRLSQGALDNTTQGVMQTGWNDFIADLNALVAPGSWSLGVAAYDRRHAGAGAHFTPLSALLVETETGTMRKRQERNR